MDEDGRAVLKGKIDLGGVGEVSDIVITPQGGAMSLTTAAGDNVNLKVSLASGDALDVRQFNVQESISSLFVVSIVALSDNPDLDFDAIVGGPSAFKIRHETHERFWSGVCSSLEQLEVDEGEGLSTYHITIVPHLWLASQRRNYRMFQQVSEPEIVLTILREDWEIEPEVKLTSTYKSRKYRVQYGETDYSFICRLLEDAGISFYFKQVKDKTKLVLDDMPHAKAPRGDNLQFRDNPKSSHGEYVTRFKVGQQVRPGKYTMRDHDYRRSNTNQPAASADNSISEVEKKLERYHYTPGAFLFGTTKGDSTPVADDRGKTRTDDTEAEILVRKRLEAKRASAKACSFETNILDLAPGVVAKMQGHPRTSLNGKPLLIVGATHSGSSYGEWAHRCEARTAEAPYRPPLNTPKPKVVGVESATVVGPPGEEIHTDEFGRVRVHFHWNRESKMDEKSSCWIHVSQPWGGSGFGSINLPRVGQEVLVDFLGGDPDRPIITGRVFTNLEKVPYKLPENKTQSGWKTNSYPGGGGFNELRFEDAKGKEQVYIQAEKDLQKLVKHNESVTIGNNRTTLVKADDSLTVVANRTHMIGLNEQVKVGMNQTVSVGLNRSTQVGAIDATMVGDTHVVTIAPPGEGPGGGGSTALIMADKKIVLDTGAGATITMQGSKIKITADTICLWAKNAINVTSEGNTNVGGVSQLTLGSTGGDVLIKGGPMVKINEP